MARTQTKTDATNGYSSTITARKTSYSDFDLAFKAHPNTKDVTILRDVDAVKQSVKNLVLTSRGERPFNPLLGSSIRKLLFEPVDAFTAMDLKEAITETIENYEPRVNLQLVDVVDDSDNNRYRVSVSFQIITSLETDNVQFYIERIR